MRAHAAVIAWVEKYNARVIKFTAQFQGFMIRKIVARYDKLQLSNQGKTNLTGLKNLFPKLLPLNEAISF